MTLEKVKELMQTRMDYFEQHLSDETITAQLKAYTANLGTVPDDIAEAIAERVDTLSAQISTAIARIPEELLNDVRQSKMYLTGGMALLNGMDQVIMDAVGIPARVAADARDCTVRGLGEALQILDRMDTDIAKVFRMQRPENKD